ncbi:hypothetical protein BRADI_1g43915v3, partial [Brachypodium distachyon]
PALAGKTHDPGFVWKIHGFSALLNRGVTTIRSAPFECSGYKWYASYKRSLDLEPDYTMDVVFKLSMYNHSEKMYHGCRAFHDFYGTQTRSWVEFLIPLKSLLKSTDFPVDDCCVFGAEILLVNVFPSEKKGIVVPEKATTVQNVFILNSGFICWTYNLNIPNFLESNMMDCTCSQAVEFDGHKWVVEMSLTIEDQKHGKHFTKRIPVDLTFCRWGWSDFIPHETFRDPSRGYLVGSCCVVKADITVVGPSNYE